MKSDQARENSDIKHWTFFIEGVKCSNCVQKLESLPGDHEVLKIARFDKGKSTLTLELLGKDISPEEVIRWINKKGYQAYYIIEKSDVNKRLIQENRAWLLRLAVTFFFASNIMMFSIAIYAGADQKWKGLFSQLSGLLFLPVLTYSALPFFKSSLQSLKQGKFSADVAIAIAFGWGSVLSYYNLIRGDDAFYFDSSASFLFLILFARYILYKTQKGIESELNPSLLFKNNPFYDIQRGNENLRVTFDQITEGDLVQVLQGQMIPVDGILKTHRGEIDTSIFSGESLPQSIFEQAKLKAGMLVRSPNLSILTTESFQNSELYKLFEGVLKNRQVKTKAHTRAEIYSQRLLTFVSVGSVILLFWFGLRGDWNEGFFRALALFTIACPCALALAIPLASITVLKRAASLGIIAKTPLLFEKLQDVDTIVFDKTGTLTEGYLDFAGWSKEKPSLDILKIILSLEEKAHHPLAKSITKILREQGVQPVAVESWVEVAGEGVSAKIEGDQYQIKRLDHISKDPTQTGFTVFKNDQSIISLYFKDQLRSDACSTIQWLSENHYQVKIFSGDRKAVVESIAIELGVPPTACFAEMTPVEKSEKLKNTKVLMIGDGHNDSLALSSAYASLAISGSAETSLQAADAYSQQTGLAGLPTLFMLSEFYQKLINQNILLSLTYNTIAGLLAIFGYVNPLMAAVLMPINSLVVISATSLARPNRDGQKKELKYAGGLKWKHST